MRVWLWMAVRDLGVLTGRVLYWASVTCSEVVLCNRPVGWPCERRCGARTCDRATTFREIPLTIPKPAGDLGEGACIALCLWTWLLTLNFLQTTRRKKIKATEVNDIV